MEILKHTHSGLRWLFLLIIIFAIVNAIRKWKSGDKFGAKDKLLNIITIALTHSPCELLGSFYSLLCPKSRFTEGFSEMGDRSYSVLCRSPTYFWGCY